MSDSTASADDDLLFHPAPRLRRADITLEFTEPTRFRFFHGPALHAGLFAMLGYPDAFPTGLRFDVPETGRSHYDEGDRYRFSLTFADSDDVDLDFDRLVMSLERAPDLAWIETHGDDSAPFRDNFSLVDVRDTSGALAWRARQITPVAADVFAAALDDLSRARHLDITFLAPFSAYNDKERRDRVRPGRFRFERFLLLADAGLRAFLHVPRDRPRPRLDFPEVVHQQDDLLDVVVPRGAVQRGGRAKFHEGVLGSVRLELAASLGRAWAERLLLAEWFGIGRATTFGLGRFRIDIVDSAIPDPRRLPAAVAPVMSLARRATDPNLGADLAARALAVMTPVVRNLIRSQSPRLRPIALFTGEVDEQIEAWLDDHPATDVHEISLGPPFDTVDTDQVLDLLTRLLPRDDLISSPSDSLDGSPDNSSVDFTAIARTGILDDLFATLAYRPFDDALTDLPFPALRFRDVVYALIPPGRERDGLAKIDGLLMRFVS